MFWMSGTASSVIPWAAAELSTRSEAQANVAAMARYCDVFVETHLAKRSYSESFFQSVRAYLFDNGGCGASFGGHDPKEIERRGGLGAVWSGCELDAA